MIPDAGNHPFRGQIVPDGLTRAAEFLIQSCVLEDPAARVPFIIKAREELSEFASDLEAEAGIHPQSPLMGNYQRLYAYMDETAIQLEQKQIDASQREALFTSLDRLLAVAREPDAFVSAIMQRNTAENTRPSSTVRDASCIEQLHGSEGPEKIRPHERR